MPKQTSVQDAIALLKADHRKVEELFASYENAKGTRKNRIAKEICQELIVHSTIEEELFYPALQGKIDDEDMLDEAHVEHDGAKVLIAELMDGSSSDEFYDAKVKVLCEQIKHHVREEEKRGEGIFAMAREADLDLAELGSRLTARKQELLRQIKAKGLPRPVTRAMHGAKLEHGERVAV